MKTIIVPHTLVHVPTLSMNETLQKKPLKTKKYRVTVYGTFTIITDLSNHRSVVSPRLYTSDLQTKTNISQQHLQHQPHKKDDDRLQVWKEISPIKMQYCVRSAEEAQQM